MNMVLPSESYKQSIVNQFKYSGIKIDSEMIPLVKAINRVPEFMTTGCCIGGKGHCPRTYLSFTLVNSENSKNIISNILRIIAEITAVQDTKYQHWQENWGYLSVTLNVETPDNFPFGWDDSFDSSQECPEVSYNEFVPIITLDWSDAFDKISIIEPLISYFNSFIGEVNQRGE